MENRNLKNFKFGNCTDIGKVRSQNEDYMGYFDNQNGDFFVVCDGMGGHAGGAVAAQKAVETIREFFQNQYYSQPEEAIYQALQYANQQIYLQAQENIALRGMGTTCVLMMLRDGLIYYGHVGDSRLYLRTEYGIKRLTKDHSFVQALIEQGLITEEEAENHPRKNELLRALGTQSFVDVSVSESPLKAVKHEQYLLCTDGLTSLVSDQGIDEVLNKNLTVQEKALRLVDLANTLGGYDNTTVQLIQFTDGGQEIIMESGKSTQIDSQGSSNNFNPPNQAYTGGSAQYIEPISESRYDDDYDRVQKSIVMSSQVSDGDYRPFLLRTFVIIVIFIGGYLLYDNTIGDLDLLGGSGDQQVDSTRAIQIERRFYNYFWNSSSGLKKVKKTYDNTRETIREIAEYRRKAEESLDRFFKDKRVRLVLNTVKENRETLENLARRHRSEIEWILMANGVSSEEELRQLDSLTIPLEAPEIEER